MLILTLLTFQGGVAVGGLGSMNLPRRSRRSFNAKKTGPPLEYTHLCVVQANVLTLKMALPHVAYDMPQMSHDIQFAQL